MYYCFHFSVFNGVRRNMFRKVTDRKLAKDHTYLYRCKLCGCWQVKQAVSEITERGPRVRIKTYYPKQEIINWEEMKNIGPVAEGPEVEVAPLKARVDNAKKI